MTEPSMAWVFNPPAAEHVRVRLRSPLVAARAPETSIAPLFFFKRKTAYEVDDFIPGDRVSEVLNYVQFSAEKLVERMRKDVDKAVRAGKITAKEARQFLRFYEDGMDGYTYLEE